MGGLMDGVKAVGPWKYARRKVGGVKAVGP